MKNSCFAGRPKIRWNSREMHSSPLPEFAERHIPIGGWFWRHGRWNVNSSIGQFVGPSRPSTTFSIFCAINRPVALVFSNLQIFGGRIEHKIDGKFAQNPKWIGGIGQWPSTRWTKRPNPTFAQPKPVGPFQSAWSVGKSEEVRKKTGLKFEKIIIYLIF